MKRITILDRRARRIQGELDDIQRSIRDHIIEQARRHAVTGGRLASETGISRTYCCRLLRGEDYPSGRPLVVPEAVINFFADL